MVYLYLCPQSLAYRAVQTKFSTLIKDGREWLYAEPNSWIWMRCLLEFDDEQPGKDAATSQIKITKNACKFTQ